MKKLLLMVMAILGLFSCSQHQSNARSKPKTENTTIAISTNTKVMTESKPSTSHKKEFNFVDEKGQVLFSGKKISLKAGAVEVTKDVNLQFVTDDNGRWKIEFSSKEYSLVESNPLFEEGNLYPINEESLKELNTLILSKVKN